MRPSPEEKSTSLKIEGSDTRLAPSLRLRVMSMSFRSERRNAEEKVPLKVLSIWEQFTVSSPNEAVTDEINSKILELGAKAGTLIIKANDTEYKITIDENTTLGEFIKKLNDNKINANLDKTGILTIVDANITNEGTTNIKNALGLELDIYSNTQKSNDLSHKTIITQTTNATSDTLLKDLGV